MAENQPKATYETSTDPSGLLTVSLSGDLDASAYYRFRPELDRLIKKERPEQVAVDMGGVHSLDDMGMLLVAMLHRKTDSAQGQCQIVQANEDIRRVLDTLHFDLICKESFLEKTKLPNPIVRLGDEVIKSGSRIRQTLEFTGALVLCMVRAILKPHTVRWDDTLFSMRRVGVDAVPIVLLISFLLGFIIAFMSSVQLAQFGANIFVASLVALAMVRELGPIMTAIIVAGRSGSAFASEIGSMKINEEVDALTTMGFDPVGFLVIPKMAASVVMVPFLSLFSSLFGIFGGMVVGIFVLDLTFDSYVQQTLKYMKMEYLIWAYGKSVVFAMLITWVGCLRGFQVRGGATEVGEATTSAVVSGIFLIILWDSAFAFIQLYWG